MLNNKYNIPINLGSNTLKWNEYLVLHNALFYSN